VRDGSQALAPSPGPLLEGEGGIGEALTVIWCRPIGLWVKWAAVRNCLGIMTSYTLFATARYPRPLDIDPFSNLTGPIMVSKVS